MFSNLKSLQTILLTCFLVYIIPAKNQVCLTFIDPCPTSWHLWRNSCYMITETSVPWASARGECYNWGGALVAPRAVQENDFIGALIPERKNAWIDCVLDVNDVWVCVDDGEEVQLRNWGRGHGSLMKGARGVPSYHGSGVLNICGMITIVIQTNYQHARNLQDQDISSLSKRKTHITRIRRRKINQVKPVS